MGLAGMVLVIVFLVCTILLLAAPAAPAHAEPSSCPYDPHLSIMYNHLSPLLRRLYDQMYDALRSGMKSVAVPQGLKRPEVEFLIDCIYNEAPELCAYERWQAVITDMGGIMVIHLAYKMPLSRQEQFIRYAAETARPFARKKDEKGIREIFDYLTKRLTYETVKGEDVQLAYFALKNNKAICNGYAQCAVMLCHFAGYSCSYVNGFVYDDTGKLLGNHAWNVALFGNRYVWFDAAWDDAGPAFRGRWFALGGKEMHRHRKLAPGYQCIPWNT